jgi:hypothetical protein
MNNKTIKKRSGVLQKAGSSSCYPALPTAQIYLCPPSPTTHSHIQPTHHSPSAPLVSGAGWQKHQELLSTRELTAVCANCPERKQVALGENPATSAGAVLLRIKQELLQNLLLKIHLAI